MFARPRGDDYAPYGVHGNAWALTPFVNQVLYNQDAWRVNTDLNFDWRNTDARAMGGQILEREDLRDIRWGVTVAHGNDKSSTSLRNEITVGLDILGASQTNDALLPVANGGSQFVKYATSLSHSHNLAWNTTGVLNAYAQWSPDTLNGIYQYGSGGTYGGRGYREVAIAGDSGIYLSGEWHTPCFLIPASWKAPGGEDRLRDKVRFVTFLDYSFSKLNSRYTGIDNTEHVVGTGVGLRFDLTQYMQARVDLAVPLVRQDSYQAAPRLHFGIQSQLF